MRFIKLHSKNTNVVYKNSVCSFATIVVLTLVVLSVMIPLLLVSLLSPYSGITAQRILFEQPRVQYKFKHIIMVETASLNHSLVSHDGFIACSTFVNFNKQLAEYTKPCSTTKYWTVDLDYDGLVDQVHFEQQLNNVTGSPSSIEMIFVFEAEIRRKCHLRPPAILSHQLIVPTSRQMKSGVILLKAELQLKQNIEFLCPFPGRNIITEFQNEPVSLATSPDPHEFQLEYLREKIKTNPAFFHMEMREVYYKRIPTNHLRIQLQLDIDAVATRYHLSVWERLGQFWLYFASFFGISFYIMNKIKDFLFGHHIVRAWEIIPWKKLH